MNIQFKKGVVELCVLSILSERDCYGYELVNEISKNIEISEGTMYPLLRRLSKEGYFMTYLKESTEGPSRKYYKLTKEGRKMLEDLKVEWKNFISKVDNIIDREEENE
ncbi:MAG: PadR family transcriptional regulator [Clostridia bacterium]|jgi:PadR family transcriptional regulator PadR|nr:PadR family transcriptional regulator [Clostridia bacterium]